MTEVTLDAYEMAWAPVTNAEFRCFVDAGGYNPQAAWWRGKAAQDWLVGVDGSADADVRGYLELLEMLWADPGLVARLPGWYVPNVNQHLTMTATQVQTELMSRNSKIPRDRPAFSRDTPFSRAAQPVVGVCLFEVQAYATWVSSQRGENVRLPTEAEWEVAAAGAAAWRRWPHGDTEPDVDQVNHDRTHLLLTSPVGAFPRGDTQPDLSGLTDMAGNVWEWTSSAYTVRHNATSLRTVCEVDSVRRVVRGGSVFSPFGDCRAAARFRHDPGHRDFNLGLRLVRVVPHSEP